MTMSYQDELHRPPFPYKFKFKFAGCPNDCVASIARADLSFIGTWRDEIQIDAEGGDGLRQERRLRHPRGCRRSVSDELHELGRQEAHH